MGAQEHGYYSILDRKCTYHTASNRQPTEGLGTSDVRTVPVFSNLNNMVITKGVNMWYCFHLLLHIGNLRGNCGNYHILTCRLFHIIIVVVSTSDISLVPRPPPFIVLWFRVSISTSKTKNKTKNRGGLRTRLARHTVSDCSNMI